MTPDGRFKTFDAAGDGYARGEDTQIIVLERLADARAAGDRICATTWGSAVNHDSHINGKTHPMGSRKKSKPASRSRQRQVGPADVIDLETHGTGTPLRGPHGGLA